MKVPATFITSMLHLADIMHKQEIYLGQRKSLQTIFVAPHHTVICVVINGPKRVSIVPKARLHWIGYARPQYSTHFGRDYPRSLLLAERVTDKMLGSAESIQGCSVDISHAIVESFPNCALDVVVRNRPQVARHRRTPKAEFRDTKAISANFASRERVPRSHAQASVQTYHQRQ
jgi:hypothetical protein